MNYIVLDLEWNQCPSGKRREDPSLPFEIIEIGAVRMDEAPCPVQDPSSLYTQRDSYDRGGFYRKALISGSLS